MNKVKPTQRGLALLFASLIALPIQGHAQETTRTLYDNGSDPFGQNFGFWVFPTRPERRFAAQQFLTDELGYVSNFTFGLGAWRDGTTGDLIFELWDSLDGEPGQPLATIGTIDVATLPSTDAGGQVVALSVPPIQLDPNTPYFLVFDLIDVPTPNANQSVAFAVHNDDTNETRGAVDIFVADAAMPGDPFEWGRVADFLGVQSTHLVMKATITHYTVVNLDDSGPGSLRQALADAAPNTVITFDSSLDDGTITLGGEQLVIDKNLTIDALSLPTGLTIDANGSSRVLKIEPETTVALHGLTLTGGSAENGGGIHNERATLALSDCVITGNHSEVLGGGIYNDADEQGTAALTITRCTLTENTTSSHGAAIHNGGNPGELFVFDGISGGASLTLISCLLEDNQVEWAWTATGGVISSFGGISDDSRGRVHLTNSTFASNSCYSNLNVVYSDLTLDTCTIANNTSSGISARNSNLRLDTCIIDDNPGNGIYSLESSLDLNTCIISKSSGHGIRLERSILHLDSCTISNNVGNGIYSSESNLDLETSTISNNSAEYGGGIRTSHSNITLDRCTISENTVTTFVDGCGGWSAGCTRKGGLGGGIYGWATSLSLKACTITGNLAENIIPDMPWPPEFNEHTAKGGGVYLVGSESDPSTLTLTDSIVAGNTAVEASDIFLEDHTSTTLPGNQLISNLTGTGLSDDPSIIIADPRLAPLGDYGGPTMTMPPMPSSPAIDAAALPGTTDQRGFPIVNLPDLGAAEYQGDPDFARVFPVDNDRDGAPFGIEQALGTDPYTPDPQNPRNLTFPSFTPEGHAVLTLAISPAAHPGTLWILERTTDLQTFTEILRHDGTTTTHAENISSTQTADSLTITDEAPPTGGAYYRFRADLQSR